MVDRITSENANEIIFDFLEGNLSDNENQFVKGFARENSWFQDNLNDFKASYIFASDAPANYPNYSKQIIDNTVRNSNKLLKFALLAILVCASGIGAWYFLQNQFENTPEKNPIFINEDSISSLSTKKDTTLKAVNPKNQKLTNKNEQNITVKSFYDEIKKVDTLVESASELPKTRDSLVVNPIIVDTAYKVAPSVTNNPNADTAITISYTSKIVPQKKVAKPKKKLNIKSNKINRNNLLY